MQEAVLGNTWKMLVKLIKIEKQICMIFTYFYFCQIYFKICINRKGTSLFVNCY